jgi:hypothetical protein
MDTGLPTTIYRPTEIQCQTMNGFEKSAIGQFTDFLIPNHYLAIKICIHMKLKPKYWNSLHKIKQSHYAVTEE